MCAVNGGNTPVNKHYKNGKYIKEGINKWQHRH